MKIAALISRILLGLVFIVFGLNGFLNFIKGPLPLGIAGQFLGALMESHFVVLLGPVIVNIFLYHLLIDRSGLIIAIVVIILRGPTAFRYRQYFSGLFVQRAP